ncbi:MAG TPA: sigma-54-dependent Fis family transcriptional regulator [Nitrospirota bacterium]|nr:sigma-54-dependent Fis family transcriptional regulator [Nitrospirota bacterium]
MSCVTIIWSMIASACLMLAAMNLLVWLKKRTAWSNLLFSLMAVATATLAFFELLMMRAETVGEYGWILRWLHVPGLVVVVTLVGFMRLYLRAGRLWLAWTVCGMRTLALILDFIFKPNLAYREITNLRHIRFLGESISVAEGVSNLWMLVGHMGFLLLVVFAVDATLSVWRRGDQRKELLLSSTIVFFVVASTVQLVLALWGIISMPITVSIFFLGIVATIAYEMSRDVHRAAQLSEELRESEERLSLAAESAEAGLWTLEADTGRMWTTAKAKDLFGFAPDREKGFEDILNVIHPNDRERIRRAAEEVMRVGKDDSAEYRIVRPDGSIRWILSRGRPYFKSSGEPDRLMGVSIDITDRKRAEQELQHSEERFRQVAENVSDFIWEVDAKGLYRYTSPAVEKILGYTPDELIGKRHFYDLFAPYIREELKTSAFNVFAVKASFRAFPNPNVRKDGKIVHLETSGVPMLDEAGNLVGYRCSDTDITERKRMEEQLQARLQEIEQLKQKIEQENLYLRQEAALLIEHGDIIGESAAMKTVLAQTEQVARTDSTVLISGETGTGKELLAREIHNLSSRKDRPLVTVNCASLPPTLIESELFGREKGAYTSAMTRMAGRFEVADGSTIFLDEIAELPLELQTKLLRVIEEGTFERLGSTKTIHVNVRIIAATNRDLSQEVQQGIFREDLFYRLNVFPITIPPLRERREDIPLLAWAFVRQFEKKLGKQIDSIPQRSMEALQRYSWPGNVRELRNVIEHAMIVTRDKTLKLRAPVAVSVAEKAEDNNFQLEAIERNHILTTLQRSGWRINGAAEALGLKRTTLHSKMKKLGIERPTN